ncbi:hypothetical protein QPM17_10285 [Marinobacter sp. TBZ242]|uniref:Uncharacterized protein n=1 Tax=Marinobacter azerbaijanicus TaxID=3050455 RepID=A0ABT7IEG1_9GAMM|nr:hypothetical protein [Marinobacter sp. TBZ242]MDL0431519.1 hypothetical protein [Marinobacter sp. TBZ242]
MIVAPYSLISGFSAPGVAGGGICWPPGGCKTFGVAVVAQLMSTPCNRFLDDGFGVALLITKGKIRFFW